jgi:hypothetical protein
MNVNINIIARFSKNLKKDTDKLNKLAGELNRLGRE